MSQHTFEVRASWRGGLKGKGSTTGPGLEVETSVPASLNGPGVGTNPEELLLGAASTCYLITLAAILERRQIPVVDLKVKSRGVVEFDKGLRFLEIEHAPTVQLAETASTEQRATIPEILNIAEKACTISNAIRGNVKVSLGSSAVSV